MTKHTSIPHNQNIMLYISPKHRLDATFDELLESHQSMDHFLHCTINALTCTNPISGAGGWKASCLYGHSIGVYRDQEMELDDLLDNYCTACLAKLSYCKMFGIEIPYNGEPDINKVKEMLDNGTLDSVHKAVSRASLLEDVDKLYTKYQELTVLNNKLTEENDTLMEQNDDLLTKIDELRDSY